MTDLPAETLTMVSLVKENGELELSLARQPMPKPGEGEVLVKVLATPINPSDLGLMLGAVDAGTARASTRDGLPVVTLDVASAALRGFTGRVGQALPLGNEGCGVVVQAGSGAAAQALLGKTVTLRGGGFYTQYRCLPVDVVGALPDGVDPVDGASAYINPMTALGFTELMKLEGYKALVHTAAASNLGQMLVKICAKDGIPLINIVRSDEQVKLLKSIGAEIVVNSAALTFMDDLTAAIHGVTSPIVGFDAIGGGPLASQILIAMEAAAAKRMTTYNRYGSNTFKQVYIYGTLNPAPTEIIRSHGYSWSVGGFLMSSFLARAGKEVEARMRKRVVDELTTTFKSHYSHQISLSEALSPTVLAAYAAKRTGEKYLIRP